MTQRDQANANVPPAGQPGRSRTRFFRRWILLAGAVAILPAVGFKLAVLTLPYSAEWKLPPPAGTFIQDRNGIPLAALVARDDQWQMPLAQREVSGHLLDAMVAVEDARFYSHGGVNWRSVVSAFFQDLRALHIRRGASTITMQVQRLRDPRPRTFGAKLDQAIRACQIERMTGKQEILLEYVNRAPFGGNLVGAGAASWRYFGKPCASLSLAEAALLAGLPQNPAHLRPDRNPAAAVRRRNHVLNRMLACEFINAREHDEAMSEPSGALWRPLPQDRQAADAVMANGAMPTLATLAEERPGTSIRTTLDAAVQRTTYELTLQTLSQLRGSGVSAAAVVVLDTPTAQCLATVSACEDHRAARIDLTRRPRSTGSALKPLIYAAAFEAGICGPQTAIDDSPAAWPGYAPADFDHSFRGLMPAAQALAESRNIPALAVLDHVGVPRVVGLMDATGLKTLARTPDRYGLSLAIGGAEASPLELAESYATLAVGGMHRRVSFVFDEWLSLTATSSRCLSSDACWRVLASLSDPDRTRRVCPEASKSHVAWKTGTSSGHRDAWCAAVTGHHVVVVWLGNPNGTESPRLIGQEAAAPLALRIVGAIEPAGSPDWPAVISTAMVYPTRLEPRRAALETRPPLTLISPGSGQTFALDPDLRPASQRLNLRASCDAGVRLWWFVDDAPLLATSGSSVWWDPTPGEHEVRVVNADGQSASTHFHVISR